MTFDLKAVNCSKKGCRIEEKGRGCQDWSDKIACCWKLAELFNLKASDFKRLLAFLY